MGQMLEGHTIIDVLEYLPPGSTLERITHGEGELMSWRLTTGPENRRVAWSAEGPLENVIADFMLHTLNRNR